MGQRLLNNRNIATKNVESFRFLILFYFLQRSESAKKKKKEKQSWSTFFMNKLYPVPFFFLWRQWLNGRGMRSKSAKKRQHLLQIYWNRAKLEEYCQDKWEITAAEKGVTPQAR